MPATQKVLDKYWSQRARAYHDHQAASERAAADRELWTSIFARHMPGKSLRVLDVGTGPGYVAHILADLGHTVIGLDAAPGMLAQANAEASARKSAGLPYATFQLADVTEIPAELGQFDAVTSRYLLWTLREAQTAIEQWAQVLRPGGMIIAADANWYSAGVPADLEVECDGSPDSFVQTYSDSVLAELPLAQASSPEEYARTMRAAGLEQVEIHWLPEVQELDRRFGLAPGHESKPNFLLTAVTPAAS
ncbi:Methyltransferase domain-containing protein [Actinobaculum suis]|uniref:Class I SAM-dependent methyltransferase n=1 Tax=Actinobaculum suis TaxID=1657 RepID=A0A1G7ENA0_9ACTO|nr:class I SAM-dependent methyltransferase [Actinobaculum suis]MDY5153186.1 class I SAM-dependent methyltransferase [Actinobaculum suis]SDE65119.1 Methyltransferase domain-containing protein [Actinobaculum suis]